MQVRARTAFSATLALGFALGPATACFYDWDLPSGFEPDGGDAGAPDVASDVAFDSRDEDVRPTDAPSDTPEPPLSCKLTDCPPGTYCAFDSGHRCSNPGVQGVCTPIPACSDAGDGYSYICTCSQNYFKDECSAYAQGGDLSVNGCPGAEGDHYFCGYRYCLLKAAACVFHPALSEYLCLPADKVGCSTGLVACSCATQDPCGGTGSSCKDIDGGAGITITCLK
jgi:hypothetical protein